ncbi:helix-turn-helix domain-containing protein [Streptomyces sviceus]|uniref:nSTAND1 domain-containing NTPase n=1 Tax=Streptomyces sviceus TaxID=285530 RepID=UPI0033235547
MSSRQRGRPERLLDPDAGPAQRFAHELRSLRARAGSPSYRTMSEQAGVSVAALSRAASGERLPSVAVVRAYARACGADPDEWERRLAAADDIAPRGTEGGESPYKGLAPFEPADQELFFGRDELAEDTVRLMKEHLFAVLVGASGSGKSSLLRAGVLPRLETVVQEAGCAAELRLITPGARPVATHGRLLAPGPGPDEPHRIVVVDQFEEIFTLCRDRAERWLFAEQLLAAKDTGGQLRVVVAVGAGFHGRCAEHPGLAEALRHTSLTVGPMTRDELRDAIVKPATAAGLRVERQLTARIVEEVYDQPGALPLLSHALRETWRRRRSGVLTLAAYEQAGGVHGAIAAAAEEVYGGLSPDQTGTARRLLLALIAPGDGTPDSRRPVRRADLREWPDPEVPFVLERLSRARLVSVDEKNVELAHEALITGWPRLQCWLEENRERLRMHRHLTEAAHNWQEHGRDPGTLYRGVNLALADVLFTRERQDDDLAARERAFLSASRVAHRMERWTAAQVQRRMRRLVVALICVVCGVLVTGQIAWHESDVAERERSLAGARRAAGLVGGERVTDPRTRTLLSIAAWRLARLPESRAALFDALAEPERDAFTDPDQNDETRDFLTDSGRTLLGVGGGRWSAWDVATHRRTGSGRLPDRAVTAVSLDGRTLALAGTDRDGASRLWRLPAGTEDPVGYHAAAGSELGVGAYVVNGPDPTAQLSTFTDDPVVLERSAAGAAGAMDVIVPSADGRLAVVCAQDQPLMLRDIVRHRTVTGAWQDSSAVDCSSAALVFDRAGTRFAAVSDAAIRVWDTASGRELADIAQPGVSHLAFTPDGRFLAVAGRDGTTAWRISAAEAPVFRHAPSDGPVTALAWDPDDPTLRYLTGGTVHSLDLSVPLTSPWLERPLDRETFSPDGGLLAAAERDGDHYLFSLRDTRTGRVLARLPSIAAADGRSEAGGVGPLMTFSPDERDFAYGVGEPEASGARFVVWNVTDHRVRADLRPGGSSPVRSIALTPGGGKLLLSRATAAGSPTGEVWNTARGTRTDRPAALTATLKSALASGFTGPAAALPFGLDTDVPLGQDGGAEVLALSPDGVRLATGGGFGSVTVWHGRTERHREAVIPPVAGVAGDGAIGDGAIGAQVTALAFSSDGRTLAVGYASGALRLWDTATRQPLGGSLNTPGEAIRSLAFDRHGGSVHASSAHVPVQRYAVGPSQVVTQLCARAGRDLTADEWRTYLPDVPYRRLCGVSGTADPVTEVGPAPAASPKPTGTPAPARTTSSPPVARPHGSRKPGASAHGIVTPEAVPPPGARAKPRLPRPTRHIRPPGHGRPHAGRSEERSPMNGA